MGCIVASATLCNTLGFEANATHTPFTFGTRGHEMFEGVAHCIRPSIGLSAHLTCSLTHNFVLNVQPQHVFLVKGNNFSADVFVISNVEWCVN